MSVTSLRAVLGMALALGAAVQAAGFSLTGRDTASSFASGTVNGTARSSDPAAPRLVDGLSFAIEDSLFYLSPGDQLKLRWWGVGAGEAGLVVSSRWELTVPDMGIVNVRGRTLKVVREDLQKLVRSHIRIRMMDLQLVKVAPAQIQVTGMAPKPGVYTGMPGARLSEVLQEAGVDVAGEWRGRRNMELLGPSDHYRIHSLRRILVVRGSGRDSLWCDAAKAFNSGDDSQDPHLFTGDKVRLFTQGPMLSVTGDAPFAGTVEFLPQEPVDSFVKILGLEKFPSELSVVHADGRHEKLRSGAKLDTDIVLLELPPVNYPRHPDLVWAMGDVIHPGAYPLRDSMSVKQVLEAAGGLRGGEDSMIVTVAKHDWPRLRLNMSNWDAGTQYSELRDVMHSYMAQMHGTYADPLTPLQAGDTVWVEHAEPVVWVSGAVAQSGFVPWKRGAGLDDYISMAGGYASHAWTENIKVYDPQTCFPVAAGKPIRQGAVILVPESRHLYVDQWVNLAATVISVLISAATFYVVARN